MSVMQTYKWQISMWNGVQLGSRKVQIETYIPIGKTKQHQILLRTQ